MKPIFEYDPEKNKRNKEKHGFDFVEAQELWDVEHVVVPARIVGEERHYIIIGMVADRLQVAVFACRGHVIRLITYHKADSRLQRIYRRSLYGERER